MDAIREEARNIPVAAEVDVCVLGGSCTGVFAAVRAARLGARVVLVERQGRFGGTATNSLVNIWHSLYDTEQKRQIIAGLTEEVLGRLKRRDAVTQLSNRGPYAFNSEELAIELDELVTESGIEPHLHTMFSQPVVRDDKLVAVAIEDKSGRQAIRARTFVDATGDGDLCHRLGLATYVADPIQPPTTCARLGGWRSLESAELDALLREHGEEFNLPRGFAWGTYVPGSDIYMLAGTRVRGKNCGNAQDLTSAEMEGRRQVRAILDLIRKYRPEVRITLQALPSTIGVRETRHVRCRYRLTDDDVLYGKRFEDAVANGSYRVDVHHQDRPGITLKYLDGTIVHTDAETHDRAAGRWREETPENPTFYQIPLRSLLPERRGNVVVAGRMLDAEPEAFGAVRVMVNMNQTGEAAGVAAYLAAAGGGDLADVSPRDVRDLLSRGGSVVI